jgi:hypothetical protein
MMPIPRAIGSVVPLTFAKPAPLSHVILPCKSPRMHTIFLGDAHDLRPGAQRMGTARNGGGSRHPRSARDGPAAMVQRALHENPFAGDTFVVRQARRPGLLDRNRGDPIFQRRDI